MNSLVVYYSKFGNTRDIAEAIAEPLFSAGTTRVIDLDTLSIADLKNIDLLIMGVPTHGMNLPDAVRPILRALPRRILPRTPVAAYDTSYKMSRWLRPFTAARRLLPRLRRLGGRRMCSPQTFHVKGKEGPLYEGEIERAREWAISILDRLQHSAQMTH